MEDVVDLIATDASASDISDKMKEILYAKAAERIDIARPYVANAMFGQEFEYPEVEDEVETEVGDEPDEVVDEIETETETEQKRNQKNDYQTTSRMIVLVVMQPTSYQPQAVLHVMMQNSELLQYDGTIWE